MRVKGTLREKHQKLGVPHTLRRLRHAIRSDAGDVTTPDEVERGGVWRCCDDEDERGKRDEVGRGREGKKLFQPPFVEKFSLISRQLAKMLKIVN